MDDVCLLAADATAWQQLIRFWSLGDPSVRAVLAGVLLLGLCSGLLGSFVVLRKMSLLGDSLGHAVLPGVCLGFLVNQTKDMRWIFLGAVLSALCGSWLIGLITRHSRLKQDTSMGLVLSGFFGVGTVLLTRLQKLPYGSQGGLNRFLFGQAIGISEQDLWLMGGAACLVVGGVCLAYKELAITSFDEEFALALGLPARLIHFLLMGLVSLAIVISIQAVGVVLLSAVLITPAATAYLLTDRLHRMVILSAVIGMGSAALGACASSLRNNLPTGPLIVLVLSGCFLAAYCGSPQHGIVSRWIRRLRQSRRTRHENLLKNIWLAWEAQQAVPLPDVAGAETAPLPEVTVAISQLARFLNLDEAHVQSGLQSLVARQFATIASEQVRLTPSGLRRASAVVRNYRLWEEFQSREFRLPQDHGRAEAEQLQHILGPALVRELERKLSQPSVAPDTAGEETQ